MRNTASSRLVCLALGTSVLFAVCPGCASISVRRAGAPDLLDTWKASIGASGELSPRSRQTLRVLDLEAVYKRHPEEVVARLHAQAVESPQPDLLFALAEICYLRGRDCEHWNCAEAVGHYYLCAGYAYHFLFVTADPNPTVVPQREGTEAVARLTPADAFDPRFRLACDLYNAGLAKCISAAQRVGRLDPRERLNLPTPDGRGFCLSVAHAGFPWKADEFGPLLLCGDYEVTGLNNQYRSYGLGVPLIAVRNGTSDGPAPPTTPRGPASPSPPFSASRGR